MLRIAALLWLFNCSVFAQATLEAGREFVGKLKLDQQADARLFRETGIDRAQALLMAVESSGQLPTATEDDWKDLHRATTGLIELFIEKGELFRASLFASIQNNHYRNFDHDYEAALRASQWALDLQRRAGVTANIDLTWSAMGRDYLTLGKPAEALQCMLEARKSTTDPARSLTAHNWRDIIATEMALNENAQAHSELQRFLETAQSMPAPFRAQAYMAQSDVEMEDGDYDAAMTAIRNAREAMKAEADRATFDYEVAGGLLSCVLASMNTLPYPEAIALANRVDKEFAGLPFAVAAYAQQAVTMRRRLAGDIDAVLREQSEQLAEARRSGQVGAQIEVLRGIATSYHAFNSTSNEIAALEQALALEKSMLNSEGLPTDASNAYYYFGILNALGDAYLRMHDAARARVAFAEVTKRIDAMPDAASKKRLARIYGSALLGQAALEQMVGNIAGSRELLEDALAPDNKGPATFVREEVLLQAARLEREAEERPAEAARYYAAAIAEYRRQKFHQNEVAIRVEYAHFLMRHAAKLPDALPIAKEQLEAAAALAESIQQAGSLWRISYEFGVLAETKADPAQAIDFYKKAIAKVDDIRAGLSQQEQRQALLDNDIVQDLYRRLTALLITGDKRAEAWRYIERAKARSFLESLRGRRFRNNKDDAALQELAELDKRILGLRVQLAPSNEAMLRGSGKQPELLKSELHDLEARFTFARQQAALSGGRAAQPLAVDPISLEEVQKALGPKTELIEYAILNGRIAVFEVSHKHSQLLSWKCDTVQLRNDVLQLRTLLHDSNAGPGLPQLLAKVSAALLDPLASVWLPGADQLIVVPSGVLNYLPFQALSTGGKQLIDRFAITYLPSASSLQFLKDSSDRSEDLFIGALGNVAVEGMTPLPGTLAEADGIAKEYPKAVRASSAAFTHTRAKNALLEQTEVHFATHGVLDEQAPLFSALLTAPVKGEPSRLSMYEITEMQLRARLVVLSACDTGTGKLLGGDEVSGLTRTFLLAGANTVVSSLWPVNDAATALLMRDFYKNLHSGEAPGQALRKASLEVRKQYPSPYFWAPFTVTGVR